MADPKRAEASPAHEESEARWSRWMSAAQRGDGAAYQKLLAELAGVIERYLRSRFGAAEFIEDCVQECLLSIHRARASWDPRRAFRPWLFAIVRNKTIDLLRRDTTRQRFTGDADPDQIASAAPDPLAALEVSGLLRDLDPRYREALVMTKLRGLPLADAATEAGVSVGTMKARVHRAIRQVRRQLERENP